MADRRGGLRPGAGRPKGSKDPHTLEKQEYELQLRARIAQDVDEFYNALKLAAVGITHMMAKNRDGMWQEVTDPAVMARCLNSGESFYQLSARNPDVRALINLFDRLAGTATQQSQVQVEGQMTLKDLIIASGKPHGADH
jgi:hypothetical protein